MPKPKKNIIVEATIRHLMDGLMKKHQSASAAKKKG
jgi:hypothetical protein